jgi:hypothetical protein
MTRRNAQARVAKLNAELLQAGLAIATNPLISYPIGDRVRLSWPSAKNSSGLLSREEMGSLSEYRKLISEGQYTCLLNEGSLIQVSFDFRRDEMVAHRLCFYPCPLDLLENTFPRDFEEWNELLEAELKVQLISLDDQSLAENSEDEDRGHPMKAGSLRFRSPLRFDFDSRNDETTDPASHLHVNGGEARIPVYAAVSVGLFLTFIISQYYPDYRRVLRQFPIDFCERSISHDQQRQLHLNCHLPL